MSARRVVPTSERRRDRTVAFQALFMLDVGKVDIKTAADYIYAEIPDPGSQNWALQRLGGTWERRDELDSEIKKYLQNWSWDRVGRVERSLLRMFAYELLHTEGETPVSVLISEAVELGKQFADEKSAGFLNGVLDALRRAHQPPAEPSPVSDPT